MDDLKKTAREILAGCRKAGHAKCVANDRVQIERICEEYLRLAAQPIPDPQPDNDTRLEV